MDAHATIQVLRKSPEVLVPKRQDFFTICAFLNGYGHGTEPSVLRGFYEWLNMQFPKASAAHWSELVLQMAFPENRPNNWFDSIELQNQATNTLLNKFQDFLNERDSVENGLNDILERHKEFEIRTRKAVRDRESTNRDRTKR